MGNTTEEIEIACTLNDTEFRERRALARQIILPKVLTYARVTDGLAIQFANTAQTLKDVKEFIVLEQGCCGFLNFELAENATPLNLLITGPSGATKFIDIFAQLMEENSHAD